MTRITRLRGINRFPGREPRHWGWVSERHEAVGWSFEINVDRLGSVVVGVVGPQRSVALTVCSVNLTPRRICEIRY